MLGRTRRQLQSRKRPPVLALSAAPGLGLSAAPGLVLAAVQAPPPEQGSHLARYITIGAGGDVELGLVIDSRHQPMMPPRAALSARALVSGGRLEADCAHDDPEPGPGDPGP